jgi:spermidine synthase
MSWLFEVKRYQSEKNGLILCRKIFGHWWIEVESYDQSSPYIKRMWRSALRRLSPILKVHRSLLLGLGGGSIVDDLAEKYPDAELVIVEYDPVMVEVSQEVHLFKTNPRIFVEDAVSAVPKLEGMFDLIIVDLYKGGKTAEALEHANFIASIINKLSPGGTLILNAFENTKLFADFSRYLTLEERWTFSYNALAIYKNDPPMSEGSNESLR